MTTITFPNTTNVSPQVMAVLAAALAMIILGAVIAFGAITTPAPQPVEQMTNQANSNDPTPLSGILEFAD